MPRVSWDSPERQQPFHEESNLNFDRGRDWGANLIRWQLIRHGRPGQPASVDEYDAWLEGELKKLDAALAHCQENGLHVVVDLHSPPGGKATSGGYIGSDDRLFSDPARTIIVEPASWGGPAGLADLVPLGDPFPGICRRERGIAFTRVHCFPWMRYTGRDL